MPGPGGGTEMRAFARNAAEKRFRNFGHKYKVAVRNEN